MIKNEQEYEITLGKIEDNKEYVTKLKKILKEKNFSNDEIERACGPMLCFQDQLQWEADHYKKEIKDV